MKKTSMIALVLVLTASLLTACRTGTPNNTNGATTNTSTPTPTTAATSVPTTVATEPSTVPHIPEPSVATSLPEESHGNEATNNTEHNGNTESSVPENGSTHATDDLEGRIRSHHQPRY